MPSFSKKSIDNLVTCDQKLQAILNRAIEDFDFSVIGGYRDEKTQNKYYDEGRSRLKYPYSNHNKYPSRAVDIVPYPIDWDDEFRFYKLATHVYQIASIMKIPIRWGGTWRTFKDLPHFELIL